MKAPAAAKIVRIDRSFALDLGGELPHLDIAYETWGAINAERSNVVLVIPAFSANCHARSSSADPSKGWWEHIIGPGLSLDTERWFVVCASLLGGCHGTTGPRSANPAKDGARYEGDFPLVTIGDLARCHLRLLDHLGIERAHAVCGGSMGAMQCMEYGFQAPERCRRVVAISGTDRTRPATAAIRHLGRRSIMLDPQYQGGFYGENGPEAGVHLAREIGTVFYRSKGEFNDRFSWSPIAPPSLDSPTFDVQSYLNHQGSKMAGRFDANSYLRLSMAMDLHDISAHVTHGAATTRNSGVTFYIGGVEEDRLMPLDEQVGLHEALLAGGASSHLETFTSPVGHDAFLVKHDAIGEFVRKAVEAPD